MELGSSRLEKRCRKVGKVRLTGVQEFFARMMNSQRRRSVTFFSVNSEWMNSQICDNGTCAIKCIYVKTHGAGQFRKLLTVAVCV
jgi:hypothetical protein